MYQILSVDGWKIKVFNTSGSKEKTPWLINPYNPTQTAIFKEAIGVDTGEAWSEKISSEIGKLLRIPTHNTDIGCYDGCIGSLVWNFIEDEIFRLEEGSEIISGNEKYSDFDRDLLKSSNGYYSFQMVYEVIKPHGFITELFDMIIFDALIGNTDRHQDNFGFVLNQKNKSRYFAPLYDNASSLGRELPEEEMVKKMKDKDAFEGYLRRADTWLRWGINQKKKTKHFTLIENLLSEHHYLISDSIQKVESLSDEKIIDTIIKVPNEVMSNIKKEFVLMVLKARRDKLLYLVSR